MTSVEAQPATEVVTADARPPDARPDGSPEERRRNKRGAVRTGGGPARPAPVTSPGTNAVQPSAAAGGRQAQLVSDVAPKWDSRAAPLASGAPMSFERHDRHGGEPAQPRHEPEPPPAPVDLAPLALAAALPLLLAGSLLPALLAPLLQAFTGTRAPGAGTGVAGDPRCGNGFAPSGTNGYSPTAYQPMGGYGPVAATPQGVLDFLNRVRNDLFGNGAPTNGVGTNGFGSGVYGDPGVGATFTAYADSVRRALNAGQAIDDVTGRLRSVIERYGRVHDGNRARIDDLIRRFQAALRDANRIPDRVAREEQFRQVVQRALTEVHQIIRDEQASTTETAMDINRLTQEMTGQFLADLGRVPPNASAAAIQFALDQIGTPFVYGASTGQQDAYDCSSLMVQAYREAGIALPRTAADQYFSGLRVPVEHAQAGDLLFYGYGSPHHVAMYLGDGRMVEAPRTGLSVRVVPVRPGVMGAVRPTG